MTQGKERTEQWTYHVFLSFRGADVRNSFLSHMYNGLKRNGITTFMDDVELERGEYISPKLLKAIETSKIHIVVLTKDYASSSWCLDELVHIMKSNKSNPRHLVFPIFLYVDPSDIRYQKGSFAKSFSKLESHHPLNKVKAWKQALTEVANISGWDVTNRSEAECVEDISREVLKRFPCRYLHVPSYAVGMRLRLQKISSLLSIGSEKVRVIGIYGMGGIGKTTLAKVAFNEFSHLFEGSSFIENFTEYLKKGKTHMQHQLLSDILRTNYMEFNSLDHAVKERFCSKHVLVVLDDVDDISQLHLAAIDRHCFGDGSRIIVTTRNMHLLDQLRVEGRYSPTLLDGDESLELFSWHAFRKSEPSEEFLQLSEDVVTYCAGVPLAVEVLGAFLDNRSIPEFESTLDKLKRIPDDNIQAKLKIGFDKLTKEQKNAFLDIACFFIGMDKNHVACILDGCNLYPAITLSVLMDRCLFTFSDNNIMMHDLLRDMGRQIVREVSSKKCGKRSRLWNPDDVISVLRRKSGTDAIEGLSLKAEEMDVQYFEVEAFAKMQELRLLQLSNVNLNGSYEYFPEDLRWLSWHGFSLESFPTNLSLESLVALDMQYSNLKRFWKAQSHHPQLKYLDLSHSVYLRETPDFSYFPNVEKLLLMNCKSLISVHKSIAALDKTLVLLNLSSCIELDSLPDEFYKLKSLDTLLVSNCPKLERLDGALVEMESLTTLVADFTALKEISSSINQLKKLKKLWLNGYEGLLSDDIDNLYSEKSRSVSLRSISLNGLSCLTSLSLAHCNLSDESFPQDIGSLYLLRDLNLDGNNFCNMQTDFATLTNLSVISFRGCSKLQSILSFPRSLYNFFADKCSSLERIPDTSECWGLNSLHLKKCFNLVEAPGIDNHETMSFIAMSDCKLLSNNSTCRMILKNWLKRNHNCIYIPGYNLPCWVSSEMEGSSLGIIVPGNHNSEFMVGFSVWICFLGPLDNIHPIISVMNVTKDACIQITDIEKVQVSPGFCIETGDQLEVEVDSDGGISILKTGVALGYNSRDITLDEIQFTSEGNRFHYATEHMFLKCVRGDSQAGVFWSGYEIDGSIPRLYARSFFPEIRWCQEKIQPVVEVEESDLAGK